MRQRPITMEEADGGGERKDKRCVREERLRQQLEERQQFKKQLFKRDQS